MNSNKASTSNILKFFKPSKRAVFFVLLAVLVLGFSVKVSFAAPIPGPAPVPGQPLPDAWIQAKKNYTGTYQSNLNSWTSNGNTPTSPNDYQMILKYYGGYSQAEINKAGIANASSFISDPVNNSSLRNWFGTTDDSVLADWKAGKDVPEPSFSQQSVNNVNNGTRVVSDAVPKYLDAAALKVVITVLGVLATFCKTLLMWSGQALDLTLNPNLYNFTSNQMVVGGWIIVRDVCNLFFLLVLLFIAICTILKIEKYHAKKTLLMLIIMALLINFSKPIAIFIFDGSQLLMNMFLSEITKNGSSPSAILAGDIAQFLYGDLLTNLTSQPSDWMIAVYYLFVVVFLFMFAVALFVMFLFMMIRIVAVMILVIVSPLAFFAAIVPDFSKMSSQWWSSLFEYCYYGPAAAFFLFLATKFAIADKNSKILPQINIQGDAQLVIQHIVRYVVVLVFLYASIFMAKKFGGGAGAAVVGNANKFMKWAGGMSKGGGAWGGAARMTGAADVYKGVKSGIAKQPYWRMITKEGREAKAKERQGRWSRKFAPFDISDARKGSEERKNDSEANIRRDAASGDPSAILQGLSRGGGLANDLMTDPRYNRQVLQMLDQHPELRNVAYKSLRDNGQHHLQVANETRRTIGAPGAVDRTAMNTITEGMFRNSSPNDIFSNPDVYSILDEEGGRGGDYLLDRLSTMTDDNMLQRMRMNVKNPQSSRVLDNLIDWRQTHPAVGGVYPPPPRAYLLR